jgi:hypothetical protein
MVLSIVVLILIDLLIELFHRNVAAVTPWMIMMFDLMRSIEKDFHSISIDENE